MGKLHELLAVEPDLKARALKAAKAAIEVFSSNQLSGQHRRYRPLEEDGAPRADEHQNLAATADEVVGAFSATFSRWLDAAIQKEITNRGTSADVVVDGKTILSDFPAPALLNLEAKLAEIRKVIAAIPTLDGAEVWDWSKDQGHYVTPARITYSTKKVPKAFVKYEATKEHPAQVETFVEDVRVGEWSTVLMSGAISPVEKVQRMQRVDDLLVAVKQARQRANNIDAESTKVGAQIFEYIIG